MHKFSTADVDNKFFSMLSKPKQRLHNVVRLIFSLNCSKHKDTSSPPACTLPAQAPHQRWPCTGPPLSYSGPPRGSSGGWEHYPSCMGGHQDTGNTVEFVDRQFLSQVLLNHLLSHLSPNVSLCLILARSFDVLGWFSPSTVKAKILLQRVRESRIDWDDPPP